MLKLKLQYFGHLTWRAHLKRPWCWERLKAGGEGDNRGWDGWMASPTQWTWVWINSGIWWWRGRPGVLQSMGLQRVGHDWAIELNHLSHVDNELILRDFSLACKLIIGPGLLLLRECISLVIILKVILGIRITLIFLTQYMRDPPLSGVESWQHAPGTLCGILPAQSSSSFSGVESQSPLGFHHSTPFLPTHSWWDQRWTWLHWPKWVCFPHWEVGTGWRNEGDREKLSSKNYDMKHIYLRFIVGTDSPSSQPAVKGHGRCTRGPEGNTGNRGGECPCSLQAMSSSPKGGLVAWVPRACLVAQSCPTLCLTIACQAPLSMGFSGKNTGVGCHFLFQSL